MTRRQPDKAAESERETEIALFRYGLIAPLLFAAPDPGQLRRPCARSPAKRTRFPTPAAAASAFRPCAAT